MKPTITFQTLILWVIAPLLLVLSGVWGWLVYDSVTQSILSGFDRKLLAMSGSLAALIDADAHQVYQTPVPPTVGADGKTGAATEGGNAIGTFSEQDPFYVRYRQPMIDAGKAAHLTFFYSYVYLGGDKIYYVLDGTEGDSHSPPGSLDKLPNAKSIEGAQLVQYLHRPWVSDIQQWEQWGLLKTSSYPIISSAGLTVAVAGADVDITIIREKTRWTLFAVLLIGVSFLVAASFVSIRIAHSLIRPLRSLKESALRIAAGNYGAVIDSGGSSETASLALTLGTLGERLGEQQARSRNYQESLHQRRRHTTLARALEEFTAKYPIADPASGTLPTSATGNCWRGLDGVFWHAPALEDEVSAACLRSRLTYLGRQLLAARVEAGEVPLDMLASAPAVLACARWHTASHRLYYATRQASWLWIGTSLRKLEGTGYIELSSDEHLEWSDEGPEGLR